VLHLRTAYGAGGGPERILLDAGCRGELARFDCRALFLRPLGQPPAAAIAEAQARGLDFTECAGSPLVQLRRVAQLLRAARPDILHCHDPRADLFGRLLARRGGPALVSTLHGWIENGRAGRLRSRLDLWALRGFDRVIAVSGAVARRASSCGVVNVQVIRNAIDPDEWRREAVLPPAPYVPRDPSSFVVGFVGRISPEKGPLDFLRVAAGVLARDPRCEFAMVGEGPLLAEVRDLAARLGLQERLTLLGTVRGPALKALYRRFDLLLSPSLTEGLPMTLLEAAAMEVPVLATRVGGVEELVTDGVDGLLAGRGDIPALVDRVLRLKADRPLAATLVRAGRRRVERENSLAVNLQRIGALYTRVLEERGAGAAAGAPPRGLR
jgi:glycosyltransferase involved in cell wall biosynthesis